MTPIEIGMKMTERVTNMRKLPPPKLDEQHSVLTNSGGKTLSVVESSGFGRSLSKKSIDMALRHMVIFPFLPHIIALILVRHNANFCTTMDILNSVFIMY